MLRFVKPRADDDPGVAARLRAVASDALELVQIRLELFALEAREEFARLLRLAAFVVVGAVAVSCGLVFLAVLVIVALQNSAQRLWALGVFTVIFLGIGATFLGLAWAGVKGLAHMFAATRGEFQRDRERFLRSQPSSRTGKKGAP
ncbi:MAG: phage holin family protein [Burkholderiaceae bacterium]|nr:phage holin family protein [Burkholderiaceae bacterium]